MFDFLKREKEPKNFKELLIQFKDLKKSLKKNLKELESLKKEKIFSIQKFGIVRFNPFKEMGGNQSFSVALLDGNDNGIVITSLYTKEGNRVYGKPIKAGLSDHLLSEEEKKAIEIAKSEKRKPKLNNSASGGGGLGTY